MKDKDFKRCTKPTSYEVNHNITNWFEAKSKNIRLWTVPALARERTTMNPMNHFELHNQINMLNDDK